MIGFGTGSHLRRTLPFSLHAGRWSMASRASFLETTPVYCTRRLPQRLTFARRNQLELSLLDKLLHTALSPSKASCNARCTYTHHT